MIPPKSKPRKPKPRESQPIIETATSSSGEVFYIGDVIKIEAMGRKTLMGAISYFYKDVSGDIWAVYKPIESDQNNPYLQGCIRQALLVKADSRRSNLQ